MLRDLFGGAMSIDLPTRMADISLLRQVPDHQEVFADAQTDESVIVEILESVDHVSGIEAIKYHYQQVCELNSSSSELITYTGPLDSMPGNREMFLLCGQQEAAKFNERSRQGELAQNTVAVYMALVRLPEHKTDILITMNTPTRIGALRPPKQQQ
ncbi:hypothetical protein GGH95_002976 [Coemansia sp. RSA 1836]|nr:hypothetical protein GGH95_002976 [Coemansia sp. RSA 1836]